METVQHEWTASQICSLSWMGSGLGLAARTAVASPAGDDNINLSCAPIDEKYMQILWIDVVHCAAEMENAFSYQFRLLPSAYSFSPLTEEGMYLKQVSLDLSTLNGWPAASWLFTIKDKTRFLTAKLPLLSLPPPTAEQALIWERSCASVWPDSITPVKCKPDPVWLGCSILNGTQPICYQLGYSCCNRKQSSWHANFLLLLSEQQCRQSKMLC